MRKHIHRQGRGHRRSERGVALVFATFAIAALLVAITGALVTSASNSKAASNYKAASQAHFVAESGLSDSLQNINATGVINYQNDVVNNWSTRYGTTAKTFAPLAGYSYTVSTVAGTNPQNNGRLIATATQLDAQNNVLATNTVVANLVRTNQPSTAPGALYLATDNPTNATFNGNGFIVDGNDHNYTGGNGPGVAVPGISTRNDTNTQEAIGSLNGAQLDNVQGYGYQVGPPIVASISTSPSAPTITQMNQFITDLQAFPGAQTCGCAQINNSCSCDFGNPPPTDPPVCKITTFGSGGNNVIRNDGNVSGCGVMIVDGNLSILGTIDFKGLILIKGTMSVTGDATIYGSLWAQGIGVQVGGTAIVYNSSQALTLANQIIPNAPIMAPMNVASLADCADLGTGVGGCP